MCNEVLIWTILSGMQGSINLMTTFFTYFIVSHPIIILVIYFLIYCCFAKYLINLGTMFKDMEIYQDRSDEYTKHKYHVLSPNKKIHPQTQKYTPCRYQKGKHKQPRRMSEGLGLCKEREDPPNLRNDSVTTEVKGKANQYNGPQSIHGNPL